MFYSTQILARRGPLGMVWLAAHMHEQLKRNQVSGLRLLAAVDAVLHPEAPLALRLSGQLLLGLVRLYSKQLVYLHQDCQDALVRLQLAFQVGSKTGARSLHTLPEDVGGEGATPADLQLLESDNNWVMTIDMVESQLLQPRLQDPYSSSWLLHDIQAVHGQGPGMGLAFMGKPGQSALGGAVTKLRSLGGGKSSDGDDDVRPLRDQTNRARSQTPGVSRLASQAESLFAAVVSSGRQRSYSSGARGSVDAAHAVVLRAGGLVQMEQDEMFEGDVGPLDLLGDVEVEVLREAPTSATRHAHAAAQLLGDLGRVDSRIRKQLTMGGGMEQLASLGGSDTPSTAHASKPGGPSLWHGIGLADDADDAPGTHHSHQGSRGERARGLPLGARTSVDSHGSGLLDMDVDLAVLMGADPHERGSQQGSVMQSPGSARQSPVVSHGQQQVPGQQDSPAGTDAQTQRQLEAANPAPPPLVPGVSPDSPAVQPARRSSARLQQAPPPPPPPSSLQQTPEGQQQVAKPPVKRRHAARSVAGDHGVSVPWEMGKLGLQLRRAPLPLDLPVPGVRKGPDPTLIRAAECRTLLQNTSSLQVERGLAAYRHQKRTRLDDIHSQPTSLEQLLVRPALQATWGPSFLAAAQARFQAAQQSDDAPVGVGQAPSAVRPPPVPHSTTSQQQQQQPDIPIDTAMPSPHPSPHPSPLPMMHGPSSEGGVAHGPSAWPTPAAAQEAGARTAVEQPVLQETHTNIQMVSASVGKRVGVHQSQQPLPPDTDDHDLENQDPQPQPLHVLALPQAAAQAPSPLRSNPRPLTQRTKANQASVRYDTALLSQQHIPAPVGVPQHSPSGSAGHAMAVTGNVPSIIRHSTRSRHGMTPSSHHHHDGGGDDGDDADLAGHDQSPSIAAQQHDSALLFNKEGHLRSRSTSLGVVLSGSGPSSSSGGLGSSQGLQQKDRATGTLMDVARVTTSTLPPELQDQILNLPSVPAWFTQSQPASQISYPFDPPTQSSLDDVRMTLSQELHDGLTQCDALSLNQLVLSRQSAGTQAPGARLGASRCFYDMLVLHSWGMVTLSQRPDTAATQSQHDEPNSQVHVQMTQQGLAMAFRT